MKHTFALYMLCHKSTPGFATNLTFTYSFTVHPIHLHFVSIVKISCELWLLKMFAIKFPAGLEVACLFQFQIFIELSDSNMTSFCLGLHKYLATPSIVHSFLK